MTVAIITGASRASDWPSPGSSPRGAGAWSSTPEGPSPRRGASASSAPRSRSPATSPIRRTAGARRGGRRRGSTRCQQRQPARPEPPTAARRLPARRSRRVYEVNVVAPLALVQLALPLLRTGRGDRRHHLRRGRRGVRGLGRLRLVEGRARAADRGARRRASRAARLRVDPGDMRTQMHQEAFPGEDISDRPLPEDACPGLLE